MPRLPLLLPVIRPASRSSTGSFQMSSPVFEHWHLAAAVTESVRVHRDQSGVALADRFFFPNDVPVPSLLSLFPVATLVRTRPPLPESETSACPQATSYRCSAAGKQDQLPMIDILSAIVRGCFKLRASRQSLALARILSADLKQTDAMALRVYRIKTIACVNPQGRRMAKVRAFDCAWIKCVERLPFVTEDLNLVKSWLADVNVPLIVYRHQLTKMRAQN